MNCQDSYNIIDRTLLFIFQLRMNTCLNPNLPHFPAHSFCILSTQEQAPVLWPSWFSFTLVSTQEDYLFGQLKPHCMNNTPTFCNIWLYKHSVADVAENRAHTIWCSHFLVDLFVHICNHLKVSWGMDLFLALKTYWKVFLCNLAHILQNHQTWIKLSFQK